MSAVVWLVIGIVLAALEAIVPGTVIVWFGLGGVLTAAVTRLGMLSEPVAQIIFFFVSSLVLLVGWITFARKYFVKPSEGNDRDPTLSELRGKATRDIAPGAPGEVELATSYHGLKRWAAESAHAIASGDRIRVIESSGVRLVVAPLASTEHAQDAEKGGSE